MRCDTDAVHPPEVDYLDIMEASTIKSQGGFC
jgi:hypothetical protein